jgi:hypothetical protein
MSRRPIRIRRSARLLATALQVIVQKRDNGLASSVEWMSQLMRHYRVLIMSQVYLPVYQRSLLR